jgi:hypothetical protein
MLQQLPKFSPKTKLQELNKHTKTRRKISQSQLQNVGLERSKEVVVVVVHY